MRHTESQFLKIEIGTLIYCFLYMIFSALEVLINPITIHGSMAKRPAKAAPCKLTIRQVVNEVSPVMTYIHTAHQWGIKGVLTGNLRVISRNNPTATKVVSHQPQKFCNGTPKYAPLTSHTQFPPSHHHGIHHHIPGSHNDSA